VTPPDRRAAVGDAMTRGGATVLPVSIETEGLTVARGQDGS